MEIFLTDCVIVSFFANRQDAIRKRGRYAIPSTWNGAISSSFFRVKLCMICFLLICFCFVCGAWIAGNVCSCILMASTCCIAISTSLPLVSFWSAAWSACIILAASSLTAAVLASGVIIRSCFTLSFNLVVQFSLDCSARSLLSGPSAILISCLDRLGFGIN